MRPSASETPARARPSDRPDREVKSNYLVGAAAQLADHVGSGARFNSTGLKRLSVGRAVFPNSRRNAEPRFGFSTVAGAFAH